MKTRIISGVGYTLLVIGIMFFMNTPIFPAFVALLSGIAAYELNKIAKVKLPIMVTSIAVASFIPFEVAYGLLEKIHIPQSVGVTAFIIAVLIMMVRWHADVKFEQAAISIVSTIAVPEAMSCWLRIYALKDVSEKYTQPVIVYIMLFALFCAWFSDVFAYFTGVFFGKHKMTPVVSPKKTWEGAIGGVILTAALNVGLFFIFAKKYFPDGSFFAWDWYAVIPISMVLSVISIFGDLSASVIKRNFGVKDYGWIIPGHGGIMDRFDSFLFVVPSMYAIFCIINTFLK